MKRTPRAIVAVINDLATDQRVARTCNTLTEMGFDVLLVGRVLKSSMPLPVLNYRAKRMKLMFSKGPIFYLEYNFRLFFLLLFKRSDLIFANDLDTLAASFLAAKIKGKKFIYDSHEIYCEVPELQNSRIKKKIWEKLERFVFPKLKSVITVNNSIADYFFQKYNIMPAVVRNIPDCTTYTKVTREQLNITSNKRIIILQGSGINVDRGAEEAVLAMKYIDSAILLIIGGGDVVHKLKTIVAQNCLDDRVIFKDKMPFSELIKYTSNADIGLTLDKNTNINYRYSLPNKLFDYINAEIAVLASPLVEVKNIVDQYDIGCIINNHTPEEIADKINYMIADESRLSSWKANTVKAKQHLSWNNEALVLKSVITKSLSDGR